MLLLGKKEIVRLRFKSNPNT